MAPRPLTPFTKLVISTHRHSAVGAGKMDMLLVILAHWWPSLVAIWLIAALAIGAAFLTAEEGE